jgi:outer membrane receptor protein involved in Fe transport
MMQQTTFKCVLLMSCALTIPGLALAQTAPTQASPPEVNPPAATQPETDEIVVTAQRRAQSVNSVGMAINVVSGADLANRRIDTVRDLAISVPGLRFNDLGGGVPVYSIRGVGFNENSLMATSAVGVYRDDVALPFPVMTRGPLYDLERTEVLKGPQGTLFGRNATGGALNFITRKPTDSFEGYATASYGRFDTAEAEGALNVPLASGVGLRISGKAVRSDKGWQRSLSRDARLGEKDQTGLRGTLKADVGGNLSLLATVDWWRDRSDTLAPTIVRINPQTPTNLAVVNIFTQYAVVDRSHDIRAADWTRGRSYRYDMENVTASFSASLQLAPDLTLTSLSSYDRFDDRGSVYSRDGFGGVPLAAPGVADLIPSADLAGGYVPSAFLTNSIYDNDGTIDSYAQELRVNGTRGILTFVAGAYYSDDTVRSVIHLRPDFSSNTNNVGNNPRNGFKALDYIADQKSHSWSGFAHTEWAVTNSIALTLAARYTRDKSDFEGCSADVFGGAAAIFGVKRGECITLNTATGTRGTRIRKSLNEDSLSFRGGVNWKAKPGLLLYATFSRGFKSGSFPNLAATVDTQYNPVKQERLDAYEAGVKFKLPDGIGQLNASAFYYDYADRQLNTKIQTALGSLFALANIPKSTVKGIEGELQLNPASELQLSLNGIYLDTEVDDFTGFTQSGRAPVSFAGSQFPFVPHFQGSAVATYTRQISTDLKLVGSADLTYSGAFATDYTGPTSPLDPVYRVQAYALVGATLGIAQRDDHWRLGIWGRNITNSFYATNVLKSTDADIRLNGQPATYGVTGTVRF